MVQPSATALLDAVTLEIALVFFRLRNTGRRLVGQGRHSTGRRSVLKSLAESGPQTVPQLARARALSRQHLQMLVNDLGSDRLVRLIPNPRHKRSALVTLTRKGRLAVTRMHRDERDVAAMLSQGLGLRDLRTTLRALRVLKENLDSAWPPHP
jgi:DNA-binding MarR family transcriptional regulator